MSDQNFREDNYLPCSRYHGHAVGAEGFAKFTDAENSQHYFALFDGDDLVFRSEGYKNEAGRDNGIDSVKRNLANEDFLQNSIVA